MRKTKSKSKEIGTKELLRKIRKPPAPPSRVHGDLKKYKRIRIRLPADEADEIDT
jgi:hypothetical protein